MRTTLRKIRLGLDAPPFSCVLHTGPNRVVPVQQGGWKTLDRDFHWHLEIMPRLTGPGGFEWGSGFYINPVTPEDAAAFLKEFRIAER